MDRNLRYSPGFAAEKDTPLTPDPASSHALSEATPPRIHRHVPAACRHWHFPKPCSPQLLRMAGVSE